MREYKYKDILVGQTESFTSIVTSDKMQKFKDISGDTNPLHTDYDYVKSLGYENNVVYGMLTASFFSTLAGMYLPGKYSLIQRVETDFVKPVFVGDVLTIEGVVIEKNDVFKFIVLKTTIKNNKGEKVCRGKMRIGVTQ